MLKKIIVLIAIPLTIVLSVFIIVKNVSAATDQDLLIESVSFEPAQPLLNQTVKIIIRAKYIGSSSLTSNIGVNNVAFSHKDFQTQTSSLTGASVVPSPAYPLYSGTYFTYTIVGKFTDTGTKSLVLKIDGANALKETNETNNTFKPQVKVLKIGDLIKLPTDPAVYIIKSDLKKHLYVNGPTFWSYYIGSWSNIKLDDWPIFIQEVSQAAFDSLPIGNNIVVKAGSRLIKFPNSSKIYTVFGEAKLKLMTDQKGADLYGSDWKNKVVTIQNGFEADYTITETGFVDFDNDGLTDDDERNIYHTDPAKADTDGDSYKDGVEVLNNYNPNVY